MPCPQHKHVEFPPEKINFKYDDIKQIVFGTIGNRPRGLTLYGESQYARNCKAVLDIVYTFAVELKNQKLIVEFEKEKKNKMK